MPRASSRIWTEADNARMRVLRDECYTWDEIADEFGVTRTTAINHAESIGLRGGRNVVRGTTNRTPAELAKLRKLWDEGLSLSQIAHAMGRGWSVNKVHGLTTRQKFPARANPAVPRDPNAPRVIAAARRRARADSADAPTDRGPVLPKPAGHPTTWGLISRDPWPGVLR